MDSQDFHYSKPICQRERTIQDITSPSNSKHVREDTFIDVQPVGHNRASLELADLHSPELKPTKCDVLSSTPVERTGISCQLLTKRLKQASNGSTVSHYHSRISQVFSYLLHSLISSVRNPCAQRNEQRSHSTQHGARCGKLQPCFVVMRNLARAA